MSAPWLRTGVIRTKRRENQNTHKKLEGCGHGIWKVQLQMSSLVEERILEISVEKIRKNLE